MAPNNSIPALFVVVTRIRTSIIFGMLLENATIIALVSNATEEVLGSGDGGESDAEWALGSRRVRWASPLGGFVRLRREADRAAVRDRAPVPAPNWPL